MLSGFEVMPIKDNIVSVGFSGWFEIGSPVTKRSTSTGCPH
jgi:hypothetical protein